MQAVDHWLWSHGHVSENARACLITSLTFGRWPEPVWTANKLQALSGALHWWYCRRRQWHPTPVLLPGKSHGWRRLVGCSPWGRTESDMTERLHFHFSLSCIGEGNGNPLQCSCLENPSDGEPGGLPSMGLHGVGHDWSNWAATAALVILQPFQMHLGALGISLHNLTNERYASVKTSLIKYL